MLSFIMENENTSFSERDRNISKNYVFIFHYSIHHGEASGYTFYNEAD